MTSTEERAREGMSGGRLVGWLACLRGLTSPLTLELVNSDPMGANLMQEGICVRR